MSYDFHKLKTVSICGGEVVLRIPARWDVWPQGEKPDYWGCYEEEVEGEDTDTGTLWVTIDRFIMPDGEKLPEDFDFKSFVEDTVANGVRPGKDLLEQDLEEVERGYLWTHVSDGEEDGEALRFFWYRFFLLSGPHMATIGFNFVLTHTQMDEPEYVELRKIVDREVRNAFLDPLKRQEEAAAEWRWGELMLANFADEVKFALPEKIDIDGDENWDGPGARWRGWLDAGEARAEVIVDVHLLSITDDDGEPAVVPLELLKEVMDEFLERRTDDTQYIRMPNGVIASDVAEDRGDAEGGRRMHTWRYFVVGMGEGMMLTVMLTLPSADSLPFRTLAAYLDRAVRRAQFPGFLRVEAH